MSRYSPPECASAQGSQSRGAQRGVAKVDDGRERMPVIRSPAGRRNAAEAAGDPGGRGCRRVGLRRGRWARWRRFGGTWRAIRRVWGSPERPHSTIPSRVWKRGGWGARFRWRCSRVIPVVQSENSFCTNTLQDNRSVRLPLSFARGVDALASRVPAGIPGAARPTGWG